MGISVQSDVTIWLIDLAYCQLATNWHHKKRLEHLAADREIDPCLSVYIGGKKLATKKVVARRYD